MKASPAENSNNCQHQRPIMGPVTRADMGLDDNLAYLDNMLMNATSNNAYSLNPNDFWEPLERDFQDVWDVSQMMTSKVISTPTIKDIGP